MTEAFFVSGSVGTSGKKILAKKASSVSYTQPSFDELQEGKDQYLVVCYDGCFKKRNIIIVCGCFYLHCMVKIQFF